MSESGSSRGDPSSGRTSQTRLIESIQIVRKAGALANNVTGSVINVLQNFARLLFNIRRDVKFAMPSAFVAHIR